jgi:hypothetical protein
MLANSLGSFFDTHEIKAFWPPGAEEPMWRTHPNDVDQHRYPHQKAISLLVPLLLSEFRYRIGRCRYKGCESYFFLPQKRRNLYLHGLFCSPSCNRAMSATQLTKQRRSDFDSQIEGYVATLLLLRKWKPLDGAEGIKKKVLPKVNSYIAHGNPKLRHGRKLSNRGNYISGNWLTKHWDEICAKAKKMDSSPPCPFQDRPCN